MRNIQAARACHATVLGACTTLLYHSPVRAGGEYADRNWARPRSQPPLLPVHLIFGAKIHCVVFSESFLVPA